MKVVEQLVDYLYCQQVLNDEHLNWLRETGCIAEPHYDEDYGHWCNWGFEESLKPGELEHIEMDLLCEADAQRAKIPPRDSKGARRKRVFRKVMGNSARQKNDHRRKKQLSNQLCNPNLIGKELVKCLMRALESKAPKVLQAALTVAGRIDLELMGEFVVTTAKLIQLLNHDELGVRQAAFKLLFKPHGDVFQRTEKNALIDYLLGSMIINDLNIYRTRLKFIQGIENHIFSLPYYLERVLLDYLVEDLGLNESAEDEKVRSAIKNLVGRICAISLRDLLNLEIEKTVVYKSITNFAKGNAFFWYAFYY